MIEWSPSPEIFSIGPLSLRWYGLLFATGFILAFQVTKKIFEAKKIPISVLDKLLIYVIVGTVVGARLGHCLFYEFDYYLYNPLEILFVWKGGLASHGGAIGIIIAVWLFSRKQKHLSFLGGLDQVALCVPLVGTCIRLGNFMNSEILGKPTDVSWAVIFSRVDQLPRHPVQLYEAFSYIVIFFIILALYKKKNLRPEPGLVLGAVLSLVFSMRFILEFFKSSQASFEESLPISMGQILSIPFVLLGLFLIWRSRARANEENSKKNK